MRGQGGKFRSCSNLAVNLENLDCFYFMIMELFVLKERAKTLLSKLKENQIFQTHILVWQNCNSIQKLWLFLLDEIRYVEIYIARYYGKYKIVQI